MLGHRLAARVVGGVARLGVAADKLQRLDHRLVGGVVALELQGVQQSHQAAADLADRIVGLAEGGVSDLEQNVLLSGHPLERVDELLGHLAVGPRLDPMHGGDQQFHERVGDLPLALVDQRRQQQDRQLARVRSHVGGCLHRGASTPGCQHLGCHVGE
ncbi:hypothetical protein [Nonomuraea lactucae]|uniref:hypothetical protein n=1 Tax=Nonomuraea lactucae TaxID=2249762 RepID=UPI0013B3AB71